MKTPIYDFVRGYASTSPTRFHMPGHKGKGELGIEWLDITEIDGADVLYAADGIINDSENYAASLFGTAHTYYSVEGSTLGIKAMLALALKHRKSDTPPVVLAARNAHRAFVSAAALLDFDIEWLYPTEASHVCACMLTAEEIDRAIASMRRPPSALYITSPDYLGNVADIKGISKICERWGIPLLVDNAHGAYLAFTKPSMHPITLGAAMCVDSAHKTLPVLTGGAYLHVSRKYAEYTESARQSLSLFASTSPSYLILQSLDICNKYLAQGYPDRLEKTALAISGAKTALAEHGFSVMPSELLKIVLKTTDFGYTGTDFAAFLREKGIEIEFSDTEYAVLMITPENTQNEIDYFVRSALSLEKRPSISVAALPMPRATRALTVREATLAESETVSVGEAVGRISAALTVSCPPAVPIVVSGELITEPMQKLLEQYAIKEIAVVK